MADKLTSCFCEYVANQFCLLQTSDRQTCKNVHHLFVRQMCDLVCQQVCYKTWWWKRTIRDCFRLHAHRVWQLYFIYTKINPLCFRLVPQTSQGRGVYFFSSSSSLLQIVIPPPFFSCSTVSKKFVPAHLCPILTARPSYSKQLAHSLNVTCLPFLSHCAFHARAT
jgi:hypothetical protein